MYFVLFFGYGLWVVWGIFGILLTPLALKGVVSRPWRVFLEHFDFVKPSKLNSDYRATEKPCFIDDGLLKKYIVSRAKLGGGASLLSNRLLIRLLLSNVVLTAYRNSCGSLLGFGSSRLNAIAAIASVILALLVDWWLSNKLPSEKHCATTTLQRLVNIISQWSSFWIYSYVYLTYKPLTVCLASWTKLSIIVWKFII